MNKMATMKKVFSDKFFNRFYSILHDNAGEIIGLNKAKVVYHPLVSGKGFSDVRTVFNQTAEDDTTLLDHYKKYWDKGSTKWQKIANVAKAVNNRITYTHDKDNPAYNKPEYWANPITTHTLKKDDCDGYSVLTVKILRLLGLSSREVFTAAGKVKTDSGATGYHAYTIILDISKDYGLRFFPLEGSFYANRTMNRFLHKQLPLHANETYFTPMWITNDVESYANTPWFWRLKFIKNK